VPGDTTLPSFSSNRLVLSRIKAMFSYPVLDCFSASFVRDGIRRVRQIATDIDSALWNWFAKKFLVRENDLRWLSSIDETHVRSKSTQALADFFGIQTTSDRHQL
jgi:hypothetical protein